jgi:thiamine pyrophosphokinase
MKKCVIIAGGVLENEDFHRRIVKDAEMVICADAGARHAARLGIRPDLVIGDLDTLEEEEIHKLEDRQIDLRQFPREKDYTDTHLCLLEALELGYQHIIMLGCLGGRFDHAIANVMLLSLPQARQVDVRIVDPGQEIFLVKPNTVITGQKGQVLSLFPLTEEVSGISTEGLFYQVPGGKLALGVGNGISNVFTAPEVKISYEKGLLLGILLYEKCGK